MSKPTFLPWWQCSAILDDGTAEIDLDLEVRAATSDEAEEAARAAWDEHGMNPDNVRVRRVE